MTILRGHHLVCLHFYHGEGYSEAFIASLNARMREAAAAGVVVGEGPDDVCRRCPHLSGERCAYAGDADETVREMDDVARALLRLPAGSPVAWDDVRERVPRLFAQWRARFCSACDWRGACEKNEWYATLMTALSGR